MPSTVQQIDLWNPASFGHGHPAGQYRWLRDNAPVYWHEEPGARGFWAAFGGHGPHYCLGSHFARIQAAAMLREIVTQLPGLFLAGEPAWLASSMISGPSRVPVSFAPSPRRAA
jgi:cytochrome P450